ncbi:FapA family protein [Priestia aryabhattai]|uniref:FapA family protein n=1 Tax=Priestia aryabhattai TaxID=412384 RepID=UPI003D2AB6BF
MIVKNKVIATSSGHPTFFYKGNCVTISILPTLIHTGNVNGSSGNIHFRGDVEIEGEVEAGIRVEAEGNILVEQALNKATMSASGAVITCENILNSDISAGVHTMLIVELGQLLQTVHHNIEKLSALLKQLVLSSSFKSSHISSKNLQPLIHTLVEKKMKHFPPLVKKYVERIKKEEANIKEKDWREVGAELLTLFLTASTHPVSLHTITQLNHKIKQLCELSETQAESDSYIQIENASTSPLYASGNISVLGSGCINTTIHSSGRVKIKGTLRGGEVYATLGTDIYRAGSDSGTPTFIEVPEDQIICIKTAMKGTTIKVGSKTHTFTETTRQVTAALDKSGRLMLWSKEGAAN